MEYQYVDENNCNDHYEDSNFYSEIEEFVDEEIENFRKGIFKVKPKDLLVLTKFLLDVSECLGSRLCADESRERIWRHVAVTKSYFVLFKGREELEGFDLSELEGFVKDDELSSLRQLENKWRCPAFQRILDGEIFQSDTVDLKTTTSTESNEISELRIKLMLENGDVDKAKNLLRWYFQKDKHVEWYLSTLFENEDVEVAIDELAKKLDKNNWITPASLNPIFEKCMKAAVKDEAVKNLMIEKLLLKMARSQPLVSTKIILGSKKKIHLEQLFDNDLKRGGPQQTLVL